jgi:voltage-gated potassium channel
VTATQESGRVGAETEAGRAARGGMLRAWRSDSFYPLFGLLLVSLAFVIAGSDHAWASVVGQALAAASLLFTLRVTRSHRSWLVAGWILVACGIVGAVLQGVLEIRALSFIVSLIFIVLLFASVPLILRRLVTHREATAETIVGALCAYILIGMDFAVLNVLISVIDGHAVIASLVSPGASINRGDFYYYSFMTMTTVGYGDVVPVTDVARMLGVLEGILGQLFLITVVARLVSVAVFRRAEASPSTAAGPKAEAERP